MTKYAERLLMTLKASSGLDPRAHRLALPKMKAHTMSTEMSDLDRLNCLEILDQLDRKLKEMGI